MSKREKHVFDSGEISHLWFHQTQADARNQQGNFYFGGDTIYSYGPHFPIACHVKNSNGKKSAILFTTRGYSSTTSGHISAVRSAIPTGTLIFHVRHPNDGPHSSMTHYLENIEVLIKSANTRKMETTRNEDTQKAKALIIECRAFCQFFKLKTPKFPKLPKIDAEKLARQETAIVDRRNRAIAKNKAQWEEYDRRRKQEAEEWLAKSAEIIEAWRNGDARAHLRNPETLPVMLRIRTFGADDDVQSMVAQVETSRGARVPVSDAIRGLRFVRAIVSKGIPYQRNGHTLHLGHYAIDKIDADGTLHAGCHVIPYSEIERIASQLETMAANGQ